MDSSYSNEVYHGSLAFFGNMELKVKCCIEPDTQISDDITS